MARPRCSFVETLAADNVNTAHQARASLRVPQDGTGPRAGPRPSLLTIKGLEERRSTIYSQVEDAINAIKVGEQPSSKEESKKRMEQVMAGMKDPTAVWKESTGNEDDGKEANRKTVYDNIQFCPEAKEYISEKMAFTGVIGTVVVCNAIVIGVEMDYPDNKMAFLVLEHIFTTIFTAEMIFKMKERGCKGYFTSGWNILDFVLVMMSVMDCWVMAIALMIKPDLTSGADLRVYSMLRLLRLVRVIRAVRLLSMFQELWKIVRGILSSVRTVLWSFMLLVFLLYVCGLFCCTMVGKNTSVGYYRSIDDPEAEEFHSDWDAYEHFGTVPRSMFTLFETCLEPLNLRPILERQTYLLPFFLCFIFLTTFGVLNVIIGTIVDNTMAVSKAVEEEDHLRASEEKLRKLDCIREMSGHAVFDTDQDGTLSIEELRAAMGIPLIMETLAEIQVISGIQPEEFFALLDSRGDGQVTSGDMIIQLARESIHVEHQQIMDLKISLNQKHNFVRTTLTELQSMSKDVLLMARSLKKFFERSASGKGSSSDTNCNVIIRPSENRPKSADPPPDPIALLPNLPNIPNNEKDCNWSKRLDGIENEMSNLRGEMQNLIQVVAKFQVSASLTTTSQGSSYRPVESDVRFFRPPDHDVAADHLASAWAELEVEGRRKHGHSHGRSSKPLRLPGVPSVA